MPVHSATHNFPQQMKTHSVEVSRNGKIIHDKEVTMRAYPKLVRLAVLRESDARKSTSQVAREFGFSPSWVRRVKQERRELGKYGPYRDRRLNRHSGPLKQRIKDVLKEEPWMTVEELQRLFGPNLDMKLLFAVREELFINNDVSWYGAEGYLPPTDLSHIMVKVTPQSDPAMFERLLKQKIQELLTWKPEMSAEELNRILALAPRSELVVEVREDLELKHAIEARDERERAARKVASESRNYHETSSWTLYPSI
jgi:hypothetical protein